MQSKIQNLLQTTRQYLFPATPPSLEVRLAGSTKEIHAAQRLRYQVFTEEFGAHLHTSQSLVERLGISVPRLTTPRDVDEFDPFCKHLVVIDHRNGEVVGTYRVLFWKQAEQIGRFYAEDEFDFGNWHAERARFIELGRSCVHPDYRNGTVIRLLWAGLGQLLSGASEDRIIGCVSVSLADKGHYAASLFKATVTYENL
jgi:putative hemolysin